MSDVTNAAEYARRLIQAIAQDRRDAKELATMTDEQLDAVHDQIVAEEKAELERGKNLSGQQ